MQKFSENVSVFFLLFACGVAVCVVKNRLRRSCDKQNHLIIQHKKRICCSLDFIASFLTYADYVQAVFLAERTFCKRFYFDLLAHLYFCNRKIFRKLHIVEQCGRKKHRRNVDGGVIIRVDDFCCADKF